MIKCIYHMDRPAEIWNLVVPAQTLTNGGMYVEMYASSAWRVGFHMTSSSTNGDGFRKDALLSDCTNTMIKNTFNNAVLVYYYQKFHIIGWEG